MSDLREKLQQSAINRAAMEKHFGFIPMSILRLSRGKLSKSIFQYQGEKPERNAESTPGLKEKREQLAAVGYKGAKTIQSHKHNGRGHLGASIMPAELVEFFIKYYAKVGDVYLDPFMGQGIQMQVAKRLGLDYYGYDLSAEFFAYIAATKNKIDDGKTVISITHGDSRQPDVIPDGIGDFSFHSPPYWDIEWYGDENGQLGLNTYEGFLTGMENVARAWLPKFRHGAFMIVNVNDFRKDGKYYAYHSDTIALFQRAGWLMHDTWIIDGLIGGSAKAFAVDFNSKRIAPKIHEYALVFKCP